MKDTKFAKLVKDVMNDEGNLLLSKNLIIYFAGYYNESLDDSDADYNKEHYEIFALIDNSVCEQFYYFVDDNRIEVIERSEVNVIDFLNDLEDNYAGYNLIDNYNDWDKVSTLFINTDEVELDSVDIKVNDDFGLDEIISTSESELRLRKEIRKWVDENVTPIDFS